jgi:hypothetical protein
VALSVFAVVIALVDMGVDAAERARSRNVVGPPASGGTVDLP